MLKIEAKVNQAIEISEQPQESLLLPFEAACAWKGSPTDAN